MSTPVVPRPAATLVIVRDAPGGLELLLLQRADRGDQNSGAWVFPGGLVETQDRDCQPHCAGIDDAAASSRLGIAHGGLDFYVAAIRECFEEAGLLLATDAHGTPVTMNGDAGARLTALRRPLHRGEIGLAAVCGRLGLRLAADRLHYIGHWVTPVGLPKRFDTRFFLALLPGGQCCIPDAVETLDQAWLRPGAALAPENSRRLLKVTRSVIEGLAAFSDIAALMAWAQSPREVPTVLQRRSADSTGPRTLMPHEPAYAEVGRLDPLGEGTAWCELRPGMPVRLSERVLRITSRDGLNTYLVGDANTGWAAPGRQPSDAAHLQAVHAAAGPCPIRWLEPSGEGKAADAPVAVGCAATLRRISAAPDARRAVCWLLVEEKTLFTGTLDPVLARQGIARDAVEWIAPARGFLIAAHAMPADVQAIAEGAYRRLCDTPQRPGRCGY